jgi:transcriptional regulator with XRE-family HTH domain
MPGPQEKQGLNVPSRLAEELKTIRIMRKLSLRVVEKKTGISNAYLSQLERGEAENPAPDIPIVGKPTR